MESRREFNSFDYKYKREGSFNSLNRLGSDALEKLETRVPDDGSGFSGQISLKKYLSQIKSVRTTTEFGLSPTKYEKSVSIDKPEPVKTKHLSKNDRLERLEKSLNGIQTNVELKRSAILEDIYQKINTLENRITESELFSTKRVDSISKRIESIERTVEVVNKKHENVLTEKAEAIDNICEKFHQSLSLEQENWRSGEKNIIASINQQINGIKGEISDIQKINGEISTNLRVYVDVELPKIRTKIERSNRDIQGMQERIIKETSEDLLTLASFIRDENENVLASLSSKTLNRKELKRKVMAELSSEVEGLRCEIKQECEERDKTEKRLMVLMEETIKRLESPL